MQRHPDPARAGDGNTTMAAPRPVHVTEFAGLGVNSPILNRVIGRWTIGDLWKFYEGTFAEINELAAQRHLMTFAEFDHLLRDERVGKFVARRGDDIVGLSVMTDDLAAWPLVAPEFFARKYPGRKVFYIGFVAADGTVGPYVEAVTAMYRHVIAADGVFVMDFCGHNVDQLGIPRRVNALVRRLNPRARFGLADRQEFWAGDFRGGNDA